MGRSVRYPQTTAIADFTKLWRTIGLEIPLRKTQGRGAV
jgi:hypothetical protein